MDEIWHGTPNKLWVPLHFYYHLALLLTDKGVDYMH